MQFILQGLGISFAVHFTYHTIWLPHSYGPIYPHPTIMGPSTPTPQFGAHLPPPHSYGPIYPPPHSYGPIYPHPTIMGPCTIIKHLLVCILVIIRFFSFNLELICTSEFFRELKLHELLRQVQFRFLKNSQVQINSKLNEKNRMIAN